MAYIRTYRAVVPLEPGADPAVLRWLTRESFERKAAGDWLVIVDYQESEIDAADIPPKAAEHLPLPLADYRWFAFSAKATQSEVANA